MPLVDYNDSSDDQDEHSSQNHTQETNGLLTVAPKVTNVSLVKHNLHSAADLTGPIEGPQNPFENTKKRKQIVDAHEEAFDETAFNTQQRNFQMRGYARNPSALNEFVGDQDSVQHYGAQDISDKRISNRQRRDIRAKRQKKGKPGVFEGNDSYRGPWAKYGESSSDSSDSDDEEEEEKAPDLEESGAAASDPESDSDKEQDVLVESTEFHGSNEVDYLGRTYMHIPQDLGIKLDTDEPVEKWFLPKKNIHTWDGHYGGTTAIRLFPRSGHLLLSGGKDNKIRLWDMYHDRELLRSYSGHSRPIKDLDFSPDGKQFLSCSLDRTIKLWDTETGKCINKWKLSSVPNCIRFSPLVPTCFIVGCSDHNILQFKTDSSSGEAEQEYNQHLKQVNTLTFIGDGQRFMSTSEDKSLRVWEWQVNIPLKFVSDTDQLSMRTMAQHPNGKFVAAMSMDNRIMVFATSDRFKQNKKKHFSGFSSSGYALGLDFSPDGKYLMLGDATGHVHIWDWKTCTLTKKLKVSSKASVCILTHPRETSKVVTAGVDGSIRLWD